LNGVDNLSNVLQVTAVVVPESHFEVRSLWERYDEKV
jgi:hypothetical protein